MSPDLVILPSYPGSFSPPLQYAEEQTISLPGCGFGDTSWMPPVWACNCSVKKLQSDEGAGV